MEQTIASVSDNDIRRIIKKDFSQSEFVTIEQILKRYRPESEKGRNRIYASILKLANGNIELVKKYVEKANIDYRDVIGLSEYPNYSKNAFSDLSEEKKRQLIDDDWAQYVAWFEKYKEIVKE